MRKVLISLVFMTILAGCGTQADQRLQLTTRVVAPCGANGWGATDEQIIAFINSTENDRLAGFTSGQVLTDINAECLGRGLGQADAIGCQNCGAAVVNQVFNP